MATSEENNEVAPTDMPPNKVETQGVKVDMQPNNGETDPMETDIETNNRETQSADVDMQTENVGAQPVELDIQPEKVEAQPAEVDKQPENIEARPAEVDKQPENIEAQPAEVDVQPENIAQPAEVDRQPVNVEAEPAEAYMHPENAEAQSADVNMQPENVEAQTTDSKVHVTDEKSKVADAQTRPNNGKLQSADAQPINEETQPEDTLAYAGEKQPADDQSNNVETQPADGQPNNGGKLGMDDQSNNGKLQTADAQSNNGETQPADVQMSNEDTQAADAQPNNEEPQLADSQLNSGESQSAYAQSNTGETQPADGQPNSEEKQPANLQPNSEETQPVDTRSNNGELQTADAQPSNEEIRSADGETQSEKAEKEAVDRKSQPNTESVDARTQSKDGEAKPVDEKMHQSIGGTQPTDAEMHLDDRDRQPTTADMHLSDGETRPADLEMHQSDANLQLVNEEQQPNNRESHAPERLHPVVTEMEQSDIKTQSVNEEMQSNKEEPQPADADLQPNNGELQPGDAHIRSDCGEIQTFVSDSQLKNEEIQSLYAEFQQNNGEMQPYNPEIHPYDVQIQPYNPEMQLHDGQIQPYEMQTQDGQIEPYNPETQSQDVQEQPYNPETQPNKRRKKKSVVWEHFTIENVSPGCRRALCNRCKQSFAYSTGSKVAGTSHLKRHIAKGTCAAPVQNQNGQLSPYTPSPRMRGSVSGTKRQYRSSSSPYVPFDQDRCRQEIAKMIIMHDYPLHMVEHPEFVSFVQNLQPRFDVGSFGTVQGDCIATYLTEKQNVMRLVEGTPGRVCISLDLWTSNQTVGYVVITGHFIDSDWKSNRRILNVVMEPYLESDTVLSHALSVCLSEWSVEGKIFSIIFNRQLNETGLENLRAYLAVKNPLVLNGQLLIGNCIGHTLGCMAKDLLGAGQDIVGKIRDSVKYVKTSDSHVDKFLELKRQLQVPSEKSLLLDDQTRWNTTYEMLLAASELKEVFSCLDTTDPDYKKAPSMEVWKQVETLCSYLKLLYDAANVLTNTPNTTPITCFHEVWKIYSELGRAVSSEDPFIVHLTRSMHEKLIKYWKDCSLILAVAVVMDPRFKMKLVEFTFTKLYGEDAPTYVRLVDEGIHELFDEYVALPLPLTPTYAEDGHARDDMRTDEHGEMLLSDHGLTDFDMYIMETTSQHMKSEIDQYLEESLLPRVQEIDVLSWWKLNKLKYPTLSKMARDILTTPVCSVTSETIFNTIPKAMDAYRNTLRPVTVEALICAKDWLQYVPPEVSSGPLKMEF